MEGQCLRLALALRFGRNSTALGRHLREQGPAERLDPLALDPACRLASPLPHHALLARLEQLRGSGWQLLALGDPQYPELLASLDDAPGVLFVRGDTACLAAPQLAMVGARGASPEGQGSATRLARELAAAGFVITSGLARGVDAAAHEGALRGGRTLAVLPGGPDRIYPARHRDLAERIITGGGALVTEFPPGIRPLRGSFPQRNRIISGLSLGTIVVEAAERSGSLVTARLAAEQGREVFAMPGPPRNPLARGSNRLLRDGANWLESLEDVAEVFPEFHYLVSGTETGARPPADPLLRHFSSGRNTLDQLAARSGLTAAELAGRLTELEMRGEIRRMPGGYSLC